MVNSAFTYTPVSPNSSSFDTNAVLAKLSAVNDLQVTRLTDKVTLETNKQDFLASLRSMTYDMQNQVSDLKLSGIVNFNTATSTSSSISATAGSSSSVGTYDISVSSLAKNEVISSSQAVTNNLGVAVDQKTALGLVGSISINGQAVSVLATDTLSNISSNIASVSAAANISVNTVNSSALDNRLSISSSIAGAGTLSATGSAAILSALGLTTPTTVTGSLANMVVNGVPIQRTTNSVSDVINGVTLDISAITATTETVSIKEDLTKIQSKAQLMVDSYNNINATIEAHIADPVTNQGEIPFLRSMQQKLKQSILGVGDNTTGSTQLSQIGVELDSVGYLSINQSLFDTKGSDFLKIMRSSFGSNLETNLTNYSSASGGLIFGKIAESDLIATNIKDSADRLRASLDKELNSMRTSFSAMQDGISKYQAVSDMITNTFNTTTNSGG